MQTQKGNAANLFVVTLCFTSFLLSTNFCQTTQPEPETTSSELNRVDQELINEGLWLAASNKAAQEQARLIEEANTRTQSSNKVAILVPSTGHWHMQQHDESHKYFQVMATAFEQFGVTLEIFKDWHLPPVMKDYVQYRVDKACNSGTETNQQTIDRTRKATMLLAAAVPDQVHSGLETGWRADHRILASQALAFNVLDYKAQGKEIYLIGLGLGGGQIVAGTSRLLGSDFVNAQHKSIAGALGDLGNILDGVAPLFGPYAALVLWMAKLPKFGSRAAEILSNPKFLWQAAQLPVELYKQYVYHEKPRPQYWIDKLMTVATPVGQEHFAPNVDMVKQYYNLYGQADLKCLFAGNKLKHLSSPEHGVANLAVKFDSGVLPAIHLKMVNSSQLANAMAYLHENLINASEFQFGVPGKLVVYKTGAPRFEPTPKQR